MVFALNQLIARAAEIGPRNTAVRLGAESITYEELHAASNRIANYLIQNGIRRGDRVALHLPKTIEAIVALYGILKAGAAYVPIDPGSPAMRAATIATDCTVAGIVTTPARLNALADEMRGHRPRFALLVEDGSREDAPMRVPSIALSDVLASPDASDPRVPVVDTDLAYILYTSGSTGTPKGVMLTHRHALTFVEWCASTIGSGSEDTFSSHAPLHFDLSVFDLFVAAVGGATVAIVPEEIAYFGADLARFIRDEPITVWYSVPSALMLLARAAGGSATLPGLRAVVFAGEVYPTKHLRELARLTPNAVLWNLYGPTETNVCTYYRVDEVPADDRPIPIGRACENTEVFAVRQDGSLAGVGEEGELYVRGSSVMKGYWGRPDRTAQVLVQNPAAPHLPELVYRTGDLVRLRDDGNLDFLGRKDHQIKSRGYRIELGEVEAALLAHPDLEEAVAVAIPHEQWGTAITAFVVARNGVSLTDTEVKGHVARRLPRYMVPVGIEIVPELPRTSTGKIDRQRLATASASAG